MDEQQLQQKERELKVLESNLAVSEADLNLRDTRAQMGLELSSIRQENLRRAIEVGSNAYQKIEGSRTKRIDLIDHLESLINTAAVKLKEEISK